MSLGYINIYLYKVISLFNKKLYAKKAFENNINEK